MAEFNPSEKSVDEVLAKLEKSSDAERQSILDAERTGKKRKSILEAYGIDPTERIDDSGRVLYPWEVDPKEQTFAVKVEESDEARKAREAQAEFDEKVAAAGPDQPSATPAGTGVAPAAGATGAGGDVAGGTAGTTAAGAPTGGPAV